MGGRYEADAVFISKLIFPVFEAHNSCGEVVALLSCATDKL